jgi:hypothetical protein
MGQRFILGGFLRALRAFEVFTAKNAKDAKGGPDAGRSGNGLEIHARWLSSRSSRLRGKKSSLVSRHDAIRCAMARIRRVSDWPLLTVLSPGPRLAGVPARGEERNDSNRRKGYEAENGSEWQSLAVFRQRVAIRRACDRAAGLR